MESIGELLKKHGELEATRIVALHGLAGVGKSELAVEFGRRHLGDYAAVFWLKADSPQTLDTSIAELCQVLRLTEGNERENTVRIRAAFNWLAHHKRWLLIADNADTEAAASAVIERFSKTLTGHVLITSRISDWPVNVGRVHVHEARLSLPWPKIFQRAG
jgi:hypothetical protein